MRGLRRLERGRGRALRDGRRGRRARRTHAPGGHGADRLDGRSARCARARSRGRGGDGDDDPDRASAGRGRAATTSVRRGMDRAALRCGPLDPRDCRARGRSGAASYPTSWETVRAHGPELVVVAPCGFDHERAAAEASLPPLGCPAVAVDANAYYARPAPRLADGVAQLGFLIHPELVDDPGLPYVELELVSK